MGGVKDAKFLKLNKNRPFYKNVILLFAKIVATPFTYNYIIKQIHNICVSDSEIKSKKSACLVSPYRMRDIHDSSIFEKYKEYEFEGRSYLGIFDSNKYLSALYNDYMKLPPVEARVSHHAFRAYWK